jgi:hypothetical protein
MRSGMRSGVVDDSALPSIDGGWGPSGGWVVGCVEQSNPIHFTTHSVAGTDSEPCVQGTHALPLASAVSFTSPSSVSVSVP